MITEKFICKHHIVDDAINTFISKNSIKGLCHYCNDNKVKAVTSFNELQEFIKDGILHFYVELSNLVSSGIDNKENVSFNSYDLLFYELKLDVINNELKKDITACLPDVMWCRRELNTTESDELYLSWEEFKRIVKHKIRFSFFYIEKISHENLSVDVSLLLKSIIRLMKKYNLIRKLPIDKDLFRCRQYQSKHEVTNGNAICSPPKEYVTFSNRMSPAGISMFYAGFDLKTAFKETVDLRNKKKFYFSIGSFNLKSEIDLVDFTKIPAIPSIFDQKKRKNYNSLVFLHRFIEDLSKPISRDGQEHIDYVPTQIITEYIRYFFFKNPEYKVGGIIYPSTKVIGSNACVLFLDHEESIENLQFQKFVLEHRDLDNISAHLI